MPNWCQNNIRVSADNISKFSEWIDDGKALLSKIAPTPQKLIEQSDKWAAIVEENKVEETNKSNLAEFGSKDWYDWNYNNWGTKWDVDAEIDDSQTTDTEMFFWFDSAWSPPEAAMLKLSKLFPEITIRHAYFEEGMCFVGVNEFKNGEVISQQYEDDSESDAWKRLAEDEFGWEPWPDDELTENEEGKVTEVPKE